MTLVVWIYCPPEGSSLTLAEWENGDGWDDMASLRMSDSLEVAQRWAGLLREGRIPSAAEVDPVPEESEAS